MFDFEALTLGEVAFIEDLSGQSVTSIANEDSPKGKALAAIITVAKRRNGEPAYTFNQALTVPLSEANALLGLGGDEIPAEDDDEGKDDSSPKSERASKRSS